ncbi:hypothetical protein CDAR_120001 [Caerostris darwini]|uniref:Uncharacterized protein n=1 Tax=Caerostris darwini TaxID=1538125 RepID=A0AAV4T2P1_9ARAC|nr:hypothetical protein CDAR_120001 [Caerostris darwini]
MRQVCKLIADGKKSYIAYFCNSQRVKYYIGELMARQAIHLDLQKYYVPESWRKPLFFPQTSKLSFFLPIPLPLEGELAPFSRSEGTRGDLFHHNGTLMMKGVESSWESSGI